jgi:hypothetical protein
VLRDERRRERRQGQRHAKCGDDVQSEDPHKCGHITVVLQFGAMGILRSAWACVSMAYA